MKNSQPQSNVENIKVAIRIRPFLKNEMDKTNIILTDPIDTRKIKITKYENCFEGFFDKIYNSKSTQGDIYTFIKDSITDVLDGINSTIFSYGQTGSGKTYTMFGSDWTFNENSDEYGTLKNSLIMDKDNFIK